MMIHFLPYDQLNVSDSVLAPFLGRVLELTFFS